MSLDHRNQLRRDAEATAEAEVEREAEAEQRKRDRHPAGSADAGRGVAANNTTNPSTWLHPHGR